MLGEIEALVLVGTVFRYSFIASGTLIFFSHAAAFGPCRAGSVCLPTCRKHTKDCSKP